MDGLHSSSTLNMPLPLIPILEHHIAIMREKNDPMAIDLERTVKALREKDMVISLALGLLPTEEDAKDNSKYHTANVVKQLMKALSL